MQKHGFQTIHFSNSKGLVGDFLVISTFSLQFFPKIPGGTGQLPTFFS